MIFNHTDYKAILSEEFERRSSHNPSYSMRCFARDIGIAPSRLSEVLAGKQGLSQIKAISIAKKLNFNTMEEDFFSTLVESIHGRSKISRGSAKIRLKKFGHNNQTELSLQIFEIVSNWQHLALLELLLIKGVRPTPKFLAKKLAISEQETNECLTRLIDVGLIIEEKGKLKRVDDSLFIWPTEVPSLSIKKYHQGVIESAINSLYTTALDKREFNSLVMSIDKKKIPQAKKMIRDFNIEFNKVISKGRSRDSVYYFSSQFFPIEN